MIGVKLYVRQPYTLRPVTSQQSWDTFVSSHPRGHLLQSWGWGELKAGAGSHPLRLFLWDNEQNRPVAAAQILRRTVAFLPPGIGHLAYIPKGPVLDDLSLAAPFFRLLHPYLRRHGAIALQVEAPYTVDEPDGLQCAAWMKQSGFSQVGAVQPFRTILLDLTPDEETLLARMKENGATTFASPLAKAYIYVQRPLKTMSAPGIAFCKPPASATPLASIPKTTTCASGVFLPHRDRLASFWPKKTANCWLASSWVCWQNRPFTSTARQATNYASSCPTTFCNGKPFAGPKARAQSATTSGAFPLPTTKTRPWPVSTASKAAGVAALSVFWAIINMRIIPWLCALRGVCCHLSCKASALFVGTR